MFKRELFKQEFFPLHPAAMVAKEAHERAGREAEVIPRLRVGVVIYCVKSYTLTEEQPWTPPMSSS
jgi:hypothetical protein